jgi:hypothetical protein
MRHLICVVVLIGIFAFVGSPFVNAECYVADPTGTMLNVRSSPNGRVVTRLRNGTMVRISTTREVSGQSWAKISVRRNRRWVEIGWVFWNYLECRD